jgi:hypothetical protein
MITAFRAWDKLPIELVNTHLPLIEVAQLLALTPTRLEHVVSDGVSRNIDIAALGEV